MKQTWQRRYTLEGYPNSVAYGADPATGLFLSVHDTRLEHNPTYSDDVNKVTENFCEGCYLDLHTGVHGMGHKTSHAAILVYWRRYGVPEEHIVELRTRACAACGRPEKLSDEYKEHMEKVCKMVYPSDTTSPAAVVDKLHACTSCKLVKYCDVACQRRDWNAHKDLCRRKTGAPASEMDSS